MKPLRLIVLLIVISNFASFSFACGFHNFYSMGSPIYIPPCIKSDPSGGGCAGGMWPDNVNGNRLNLNADSSVDDPDREIAANRDRDQRKMGVCMLNSDCEDGSLCIKHRGLYGICESSS